MDQERNNQSKPDRGDYVLLGVCIIFYLLFPLLDGPVWCADSNGYATMHITREPLYPTFLALCRGIAGIMQTDYLMAAVILQSLLAGFAAWFAGYTVRRVKNQSRILQLAAILFQFAVALLCRFAANRGSAYTDSILTEGLGLSLFLLFTLQLFLYMQTDRTKHLAWTLLFSLLLVSLRKQMLVTLFVMAIVFAWYDLVRYRKVYKFLGLLVLVCGVFVAGKGFDRVYQYAVRGVWMEHSGNSMGLLCTLLYSSDAERDRGLFEDEAIEELYSEIMRQADEQQLLYAYAEPGWLSVSSHYADCYDAIGYGIINPVVEGYIAEHFDYSEAQTAMKYDEICGRMSRTLFMQEPMPLFRVYLYNTYKGFVNSIARSTHLLSIYAVAAYLAMGVVAVYLIRKKKELEQKIEQNAQDKQPAWKEKELLGQIDRSLCFALIVIAGIAINALVVGLMIFAQPRYMIYGMGLFYTAACMLLYDVINVTKTMRA